MKRIVVKLGTGILAKPGGRSLDVGQFRRLADEFAEIVAAGHSLIVVSSGAVTAGVGALGLTERPTDLPGKQACASVGQPLLIREFARHLGRHDLQPAQLLLTHDDIDSRKRRVNARTTLERLLAAKTIVPIFNENDSVATEELSFGDNDRLSAEVATLAGADLLIILTQVDGLLDENGKVIPLVRDIDRVKGFANGNKGRFSRGGMISKLEAVRMAVDAGIMTVIMNGGHPDRIAAVIAGDALGTRFLPQRKSLSAAPRARRS